MIDLQKHIDFIFQAHQTHAVAAKNTYRLWDKKTPYAMHPVWCAMTLLTETSLSEKIRSEGALALLYHDVLEDTLADLPEKLPKNVEDFIHQMTYKGGWDQEVLELATKPMIVQLYKLYDKTSNLLDSVWMDDKLFAQYWSFTQELGDRVEKKYGTLNIVRFCRSLPPRN